MSISKLCVCFVPIGMVYTCLHIYMPHALLNRRCLADAGVKVGDASFAADALSCVGHGLIEPKKTF